MEKDELKAEQNRYHESTKKDLFFYITPLLSCLHPFVFS